MTLDIHNKPHNHGSSFFRCARSLYMYFRLIKQDTAGQERFHALGPIYYRDSNGAVLVYDITDEDSFHRVSYFLSANYFVNDALYNNECIDRIH